MGNREEHPQEQLSAKARARVLAELQAMFKEVSGSLAAELSVERRRFAQELGTTASSSKQTDRQTD